MFTTSHATAVNDPAARGGGPKLTRSQVWRGLVLKAENPVPFLEAMSACAVAARGEHWLVRDFTLRGEDMQERVVFEPERRVVFERTKGSAMGTVTNEIVEREDGELELRFGFSLEVDGLAHGSAEEAAYAERMSRSYFEGVASTLAEIRRRVAAGELDACPPRAGGARGGAGS